MDPEVLAKLVPMKEAEDIQNEEFLQLVNDHFYASTSVAWRSGPRPSPVPLNGSTTSSTT